MAADYLVGRFVGEGEIEVWVVAGSEVDLEPLGVASIESSDRFVAVDGGCLRVECVDIADGEFASRYLHRVRSSGPNDRLWL
jgi:hypothetical protein